MKSARQLFTSEWIHNAPDKLKDREEEISGG